MKARIQIPTSKAPWLGGKLESVAGVPKNWHAGLPIQPTEAVKIDSPQFSNVSAVRVKPEVSGQFLPGSRDLMATYYSTEIAT